METFTRDGHTIHWGDSLEALSSSVADSSVDLIFADPPYNIGKRFGDFHDRWDTDEKYSEWCYQWIELCVRKLSATGTMYLMTSTQAMPYLDLFVRKKLTILSRIVWHYDSSGVQARKYFGSLYEPILFCVKDASQYVFNADAIKVEARTGAVRRLIDYRKETPTFYNSQKVPGNVWTIPRVRYRMDEYEDHPSQKPESLLERIILASSNEGQTVLDPFAGSFTTGAVARRLNRRSISIESQVAYLKIGLRRLGIQSTYLGEPLQRDAKTYVRKNGTKVPDDCTLELFEEP
jgi:site-specific DNA-methyltransferase (adenine-specific)